MNAPTLFDLDAPRARRTDPSTSKNAALRMAPASPKLEAQILDVLGRYRKATKDQVCLLLEIDPRRWPSVASCLTRLRNAGKLDWTGVVVNGQNEWRLATEDVPTRGVL